MKRFLALLTLSILSCSITVAATVPVPVRSQEIATSITLADFAQIYFTRVAAEAGVPETSRYITLRFRNVPQNTALGHALQKAVYLNLIQNESVTLPLKKRLSQDFMAQMVERNFKYTIDYTPGARMDAQFVTVTLDNIYAHIEEEGGVSEAPAIAYAEGFQVLADVYGKLKYEHFDGESFSDTTLMRGAVKGMVEASGDQFSSFFPPAENADYVNEFTGEFE